MTTLHHLAAGLDALDDFVKHRLRQAVAELKLRQDQIDASLDRPGDLSSLAEPAIIPSASSNDRSDGDVPLNDEERDEVDQATLSNWAAAAASAVELAADRSAGDDGPPATWLVP